MADDQPIVAAGGWCAPSETIYSMVGHSEQMSREMLLAWGRAEPTPEEITRARMEHHEHFLADTVAHLDTKAFLAQVEATNFGTSLARSILELHQHYEQKWGVSDGVDLCCSHCEEGENRVQWPCPTVQVVLKYAGVEWPDRIVPVEPVWAPDESNPHWPYPAEPVELGFTLPEVSIRRGGITFQSDNP